MGKENFMINSKRRIPNIVLFLKSGITLLKSWFPLHYIKRVFILYEV